MVDLAAFMGLKCSSDQALEIWQSLREPSAGDDSTAYVLPPETLEWMDDTMSRLLPEPMLGRWGLDPQPLRETL